MRTRSLKQPHMALLYVPSASEEWRHSVPLQTRSSVSPDRQAEVRVLSHTQRCATGAAAPRHAASTSATSAVSAVCPTGTARASGPRQATIHHDSKSQMPLPDILGIPRGIFKAEAGNMKRDSRLQMFLSL